MQEKMKLLTSRQSQATTRISQLAGNNQAETSDSHSSDTPRTAQDRSVYDYDQDDSSMVPDFGMGFSMDPTQ